MNKGKGLLKDYSKTTDYCGLFRCGDANIELPEEFTLAKEYVPDIRDQKTINSCVGFATTNVMQILNYKETGKRDRFSPGYVYGKCRNDEDTYEGMYIRDMLDHLIKTGAPFESDFPYNEEMTKIREMVKNRPELDKKAQPYHIEGYEVYAQGDRKARYKAIKTALYKYNVPILIAADFPGGSHAVCIIGWNDKTQKWKIVNSWGEDYGDKGIGYIRYESLDRGYLLVDAKNKEVLMPFIDVPETAWYYNAIKTAYNAGFVNGVSATEFQPEKNTTRAEVSQIIVNYAKKQDEVTRSLSEDIKLIKEKLGLK